MIIEWLILNQTVHTNTIIRLVGKEKKLYC
jgi:hypothetical protein